MVSQFTHLQCDNRVCLCLCCILLHSTAQRPLLMHVLHPAQAAAPMASPMRTPMKSEAELDVQLHSLRTQLQQVGRGGKGCIKTHITAAA